MLTLKLISEETDRVIKGLNKKHFPNAEEAINKVLDIDKKRREAQQKLDANLSEAKKKSALIGQLMKQGKKDEAESDEQTFGRREGAGRERPPRHSLYYPQHSQ